MKIQLIESGLSYEAAKTWLETGFNKGFIRNDNGSESIIESNLSGKCLTYKPNFDGPDPFDGLQAVSIEIPEIEKLICNWSYYSIEFDELKEDTEVNEFYGLVNNGPSFQIISAEDSVKLASLRNSMFVHYSDIPPVFYKEWIKHFGKQKIHASYDEFNAFYLYIYQIGNE